MNKALVETRHLKKYFKTGRGNLHAVDDVSLSIYEGQTLGVVGESGCGKSTFGRTILRLIDPTDGQIFYDGTDITNLGRKELQKLRQQMQIIFQDPYASLNPRMTVQELIAHPLVVNHLYPNSAEREAYTLKLMDTVGLARRVQYSYPHELDGGRRQRIGIARALSLNPKFIVCDEPVSALDVSIQAQILNLMMDLQQERNLTYLFITHNMAVVKHISDTIAVMYLGQCVELAPAKELFRSPQHPYTQALLSAIPRIDLEHARTGSRGVQGELTSPIEPPESCRFASRCEHACEACRQKSCSLQETSPGHFVACMRIDDLKKEKESKS